MKKSSARMNLVFGLACTKTVAALCAVLACIHVRADFSDKFLRFSSPGMDRYADGSIVRDGECYALVWSPADKEFLGFNADGTAISPEDRVVVAAPLAKDGRCTDTLFQIPGDEYNALAGGTWAVCLVDTRDAEGNPTGVGENGAPRRVNRWGFASLDVRLGSSMASTLRTAYSSASAEGNGATTTTISTVPESAPHPKITEFEVEDHLVALSVEGAAPYLTYDVESGETPSTLVAGWSVAKKDGNSDGKVAIKAWKSGRARFYRVTRALPK